MKRLSVIGILGFCILLASCQRSRNFRDEDKYYRQGSDYNNRKGNATSRAERFGQPKKRIFILPFYNLTPLGGEGFGAFAADEMSRELRSKGQSIVPEDIRSSETSKDFYAGDKIRLGPLVREGKRLGVSMLVVGKIKKITYRVKGDEVGILRKKKSIAAVDAEIRIFDISGGKELLFDEKSADNASSELNLFNDEDDNPNDRREENVKQAIRSLARIFAINAGRAIEKTSWEGRIAKILGTKIYINAGRQSGLNVGDILKVLTVGEDVYDPITGTYLGRAMGPPKGTLEIVDYLGSDGAVAAIHSGGNFVENDIVQLY